MSDPHFALLVVFVGLVFLLAGFIKGVVGMGLPTIAIALLATVIGLKQGIAIMLMPTLVSNILQASIGGAFLSVLRRFWPFLVLLAVCTWFGTGILAKGDAVLLAAVLGVLLVLYAAYGLTRPRLPAPGAHERWLTPVVGVMAGFVNGMTGSFSVPGVVYLQALGLPKDALVQAMGIAFMLGAAALGVALAGHGLFPAELGGVSSAAVLPTLAGMWFGQRIRKRLSEASFRRVFLVALLLLGLWLALRPLLG